MTHKLSHVVHITSLFISLAIVFLPRAGLAEPLAIVEKVAAQPLLAQVKQVEEALDFLGEPLPPAAKQAIAAAADAGVLLSAHVLHCAVATKP